MTNKTTALLKDAIIQVAENVGKGSLTAYLERQAKKNPVAFFTLLGKVLPLQVTGDRETRSPSPRSVTYRIFDPTEPQPDRLT